MKNLDEKPREVKIKVRRTEHGFAFIYDTPNFLQQEGDYTLIEKSEYEKLLPLIEEMRGAFEAIRTDTGTSTLIHKISTQILAKHKEVMG
jgi:hypothetical protein